MNGVDVLEIASKADLLEVDLRCETLHGSLPLVGEPIDPGPGCRDFTRCCSAGCSMARIRAAPLVKGVRCVDVTG
eukprot:m.28619 g.28619  ORF g.28619 m.28619 type:complete len:75 (+) comp6575_c0_seq2:1869-2093(+)